MKSTKTMIIIAMFAAVIAVLAQIAIPLPSGVPVTLQTFAVALTAVVLGARLGSLSTLIYILLGAAGAPVFTGFNGGLGAIVGKTGGFIWGFLFLAFFTGAGAAVMTKTGEEEKNRKRHGGSSGEGAGSKSNDGFREKRRSFLPKITGFLLGLTGLLICHVFGTIQYALLGNMGFRQAALLVSVPFLIKDICSLALAFLLGIQVRRQLYRASFLQKPARGRNVRQIWR
ncbi:MAG TPA: biotin transporter BioY [Candidatus Eisenbergiella merdavium]|uniref:Biotin transporter n=1 Tax=Candidatus Eisenbergiella merdavium TaxID=2838551 RepID=A0A9D2SQZ1_9FIRM|nr:biotin transporter BioY [Candidatus Eisenbergiella merdavium]